jgi:polysaccharide biosynthesis protein PslH
MTQPLNILFLSRWFPYPMDNGSKIRVYNLLKHLGARHTIDLISFTSEPIKKQDLEAMSPYINMVKTAFYRKFKPTRVTSILGFFSSLPRSVLDTYSKDMEKLVDNAFKEKKYDVVIASQIDMAPYALRASKTPKILEEIEISILKEFSQEQAWFLEKTRRSIMWKKWERYVRKTINQFQGVTVVSHHERDVIQSLTKRGVKVFIAANGVDIDAHQGDYGPPLPNTLIYSGSLTYGPNFDAINYFLRDIYPMILSRRPGIDLFITGKLKGVPVHLLPEYSGVKLTGYLEDIRPLIAQSWVNIVPLRLGGGTRLKILESLALGTPVVSTSKGAEGLGLTAGKHYMLGDSPEEFANSVIHLLESESLRKNFSIKGREAVEALYDWKKIGPCFNDFIEEIAYYR